MPQPSFPTLARLADDLEAGRTTSRALVEECLARIEDPAGEGGRTFISVDREGALAAAEAMDALRRAGAPPSRYAGIPVAIKDLFDIAGQVSRGGSKALDDAPPAERDAVSVARLRRAGLVAIGRTNMTEFAYSGLGLNPHYGTPASPWRRDEQRIPGGSSSGSAVAVSDGMAYGGLGSDTGGSCRIPAAFTGTVGLKPTARRVPLDGALPLSSSLDSIGPIARSVACCAALDAILSDGPEPAAPLASVAGLRFAVPTTLALDDLDATVAEAFDLALSRLSEAGARIERIPVPEFAEIAPMNAKGGFTAAESFAWHRKLLAERRDLYDPRVSFRIARGESISAADYIDILEARRSLIARAAERLSAFDAVLMPTVPVVPPRISDFDGDEKAYSRINLLVLRNPTFINMIDGCALSLPLPAAEEAPVGLMVAAPGGEDRRLLAVAGAIEALFGGGRA
ncbi:amidase [Enterovirga rhinocerotis]|uniref:Aspartyl-tRNA(Asn)/glutamyl-tRNA(Gln) amidotransferase subunit A n=1 Tax=Enterovirga rhinocerotis TaxID=1339210 RepID=A0A4V3DYM5_9HYPH|nr:amidase [Enterovirga rhinocerotis]TDR93249.1 aspartyl-tRNA(Asn)/glutamyl-tRNA(Gln) amidotransferase subunit A [Enterovirga rhinocerotis]